ncbi:MAG: hypothetical protein GY748_11520, partial [Planctomycetaceae bacterium]|nr:hypothetical protein [Planctomycetaceae bacterium]
MFFLLMLYPVICCDWSGLAREESSLEVEIARFSALAENNIRQFTGNEELISIGISAVVSPQEGELNEDDLPPRPRVAVSSKRKRPSYETKRNVVYKQADDGELKCDIFIPSGAGPFPAIVAVHGGAWR